MGVLESLPSRPLRPGELTALNRADAVDLAVSVESEGEAESLLVAVDEWVAGIVFADGRWRVVERVALDEGTERIDGLQACETAVLDTRDEAADDGRGDTVSDGTNEAADDDASAAGGDSPGK